MPVPALRPDFEQRLTRRVRARRLSRGSRVGLACYALVALAASVSTMRHVGIAWGLVAASMTAPLVVAAAMWRSHLVSRFR